MANALLPDSREDQAKRQNPGDSAFDDLINRNYSPEEKRRLKNLSEGESSVSPGLDDGESKSIDRLSENEKAVNTIPYRTDNSAGVGRFSKLRTVFKGKRGLFLGGGLVGLLIGAPFAILLLLPLKLPALLDIINTGPMRGVEYAMEHRTERYVMSYILTKGGTVSNSNVIVTGRPMQDLFANMKAAKFEENLKKNYDITIEGRGQSVQIKRGADSLGTFSSFDELDDLMKRDRVFYRDIKKIVKNEIPAWRWMKRAHMSRWIKLKYDVPRYGIRKSNEPDADKKVAELRKQQLDSSLKHASQVLSRGISCITGGSCDLANTGVTPDEKLNTTDDTARDVVDSTSQESRDVIENNAQRTGETRQPKSVMSELTEKLTSTVVGKVGAKAIPIIGWVDLAATLSHIAMELQENDTAYRIMSLMREQSYANLWGTWAVYANQVQVGDMDQDFAGVLASQLDGAEESRAFTYESGSTGGVEIEDGMKINSQLNNNAIVAFRNTLEQNLDIEFLSNPAAAKLNPNYWILEGWYQTLGDGGLGGELWEGIGSIFSSLYETLTPSRVQEYIETQAAGIVGSVFETLNLGVDPSAVGADLFNNLHAGSTAVSNTYMGDQLGGGELSDEQMSGVIAAIDKEDREYYSSQNQFALIFSREYKNSFVNKLLGPSGSSGKAILKNIASLPFSSWGEIFSSNASASSGFENLYNIQMKGYTPEELSQPLSVELTSGDGICADRQDPATSNICLLDKAVIDSMNAALTDGKSVEQNQTNTPITNPDGISSYQALKNGLAQKYGNGRIPDGVLCNLGPAWGGHKVHCEAQANFIKLNNAYKERFGVNISVTSSYRSYAEQVNTKRIRGRFAATPGTSNHGWGLALDLGGGINTSFQTTQYKWMFENAPKYGWNNPSWARDHNPSNGEDEPWHWEYGTR